VAAPCLREVAHHLGAEATEAGTEPAAEARAEAVAAATVTGVLVTVVAVLAVVMEAGAAHGGDSRIEVVVSHEILLGRSRREDGVRESS
jgi:hypothetical protein